MKLKKAIYQQAYRLKKIAVPRQENPFLYHASEAGECRRKLVLNRLGRPSEREEQPVNKQAELEMLFNDGHLHEAAMIDYIKQAPGYHVTNLQSDRYMKIELPNGQYIWIFGHPDAIITETKTGKKTIFEAKGLNTFYCKGLVDGDVESLKKTYHKAVPQSRMYRRMFDVDDSTVVVKDKNNSVLYEFEVEKDEKAEDRLIQKFIDVAMACLPDSAIAEENSLPNCDYIKGDKRCNFCDYPNDCGVGR